jgi:hypothetical protein
VPPHCGFRRGRVRAQRREHVLRPDRTIREERR